MSYDTHLSTRILKARKPYRCYTDYYLQEWISSWGDLWLGNDKQGNPIYPTFAEKRMLVQAIRIDKFMILPGMLYKRSAFIFEGDFCCCKYRIDLLDFCNKYNMFSED